MEEKPVEEEQAVAAGTQAMPSQSQAGVKKPKKKVDKKTKEERFAEKEEDLKGIGYFDEPQLVDHLWNDEAHTVITAVYAKGNYSYVLEMPEGSRTN